MVKQILRVTDMHCPSCAMRLEGLEDDLPGVVRVRASYPKQQMEVEYDETRLSLPRSSPPSSGWATPWPTKAEDWHADEH